MAGARASKGLRSIPEELISGGSLHVIDDQVFLRPSGWHEFQSELLLDSSKDRRACRLIRWRGGGSRIAESRCGLVRRKFQTEIEQPWNAGFVDNRAACCPADQSGKAIQTDPLRLEDEVPARA